MKVEIFPPLPNNDVCEWCVTGNELATIADAENNRQIDILEEAETVFDANTRASINSPGGRIFHTKKADLRAEQARARLRNETLGSMMELSDSAAKQMRRVICPRAAGKLICSDSCAAEVVDAYPEGAEWTISSTQE